MADSPGQRRIPTYADASENGSPRYAALIGCYRSTGRPTGTWLALSSAAGTLLRRSPPGSADDDSTCRKTESIPRASRLPSTGRSRASDSDSLPRDDWSPTKGSASLSKQWPAHRCCADATWPFAATARSGMHSENSHANSVWPTPYTSWGGWSIQPFMRSWGGPRHLAYRASVSLAVAWFWRQWHRHFPP